MKKVMVLLTAYMLFGFLGVFAAKGDFVKREFNNNKKLGDKTSPFKTSVNPTITHDEAIVFLMQFGPVLLMSNEEFDAEVASSTERKTYATIAWVEPGTGCIGYTTYWVHSFLGITWGQVHATDTYVACP